MRIKEELKIRVVPISLGVVGLTGSLFGIYTAIKHLHWTTVFIIVLSIIIIIFIISFISLNVSARKLLKKHNDLIEEYNELKIRHEALADRFDKVLAEKEKIARDISNIELAITILMVQEKQDVFQNILTFIRTIRRD